MFKKVQSIKNKFNIVLRFPIKVLKGAVSAERSTVFSKGPSINYVVSVGREGVKNCQFYLVKRQQRGRGSEIAVFEMT